MITPLKKGVLENKQLDDLYSSRVSHAHTIFYLRERRIERFSEILRELYFKIKPEHPNDITE